MEETTPMKNPIRKVKELKMWAVYSIWGYHAFYQTEELARKHWKDSPKNDCYYQIFPVDLEFLTPKKTRVKR